MKTIKLLRDIHQEATELYSRLSIEVKDVLKPKAEDRDWFFLSRVKMLESFALKIETGRVPEPKNMEDFFACTIVVPTVPQIQQAEEMVRLHYDFKSRRPLNDTTTDKTSSNFRFDDLRLYVARRPLSSGRDGDLDGLIFEVQIKTILQHAWSVATHDLIYKSESVSWPRERIAFQVKAMLEHAEIAIAEASRLAETPSVAKNDGKTSSIQIIIENIIQIWPRDNLPTDIKRLAETAYELLRICDLPADQIAPIVDAEINRIGILPRDISPYAFIVQALAHSTVVNLHHKFNRGHIKTRVVVHSGMDLPHWMKAHHPRIVNLG